MDRKVQALDEIRESTFEAMCRLEAVVRDAGLSLEHRIEISRALGRLDHILILARAHGSGGPAPEPRQTFGDFMREEDEAVARIDLAEKIAVGRAIKGGV